MAQRIKKYQDSPEFQRRMQKAVSKASQLGIDERQFLKSLSLDKTFSNAEGRGVVAGIERAASEKAAKRSLGMSRDRMSLHAEMSLRNRNIESKRRDYENKERNIGDAISVLGAGVGVHGSLTDLKYNTAMAKRYGRLDSDLFS